MKYKSESGRTRGGGGSLLLRRWNAHTPPAPTLRRHELCTAARVELKCHKFGAPGSIIILINYSGGK
jgi:hypothetical protein